MKKLKLYESFRSESATLEFRDAELGKSVDVNLVNPYPALKGGMVVSGVCVWTGELDTSRSGVDGLATTLRSIDITIEVEDEETDETLQVDINIPNIDPEQCVREDLYTFPLYLSSIEIDMRHTEEQEFWKFSYSIGTPDY